MKRKNESGEYDFGIYEVYYDDKGNVIGWTKESMTPICPSEGDLDYELTALKKETLLYTED